MVLGPISMSKERAEVMLFSEPLFMDQQIIAYSRPTLQPDLVGFVRPFTPFVSTERERESVSHAHIGHVDVCEARIILIVWIKMLKNKESSIRT